MDAFKDQQLNIKKIAQKYQLEMVLLFGSFAVGKEHKNSDFDLAILGKNDTVSKEILKLYGEFSKIFKKEIDITILNTANPLLLHQVSQNAILLYGKHADFSKFKLYAFNRYNDYLPYFKLEEKLNKKIVQRYAH
jgi:uncharacterized protein